MPMGAGRFAFGSRLGIDLTWTIRFRSVQPVELLVTGHDLRDWAGDAGLPAAGLPSDSELVDARVLREAIYRAARSVIDGHAITTVDRKVINHAATTAVPVPRLTASGTSELVAPADTFTPILAMVARDAIDVLSRGDGRLRLCADERCSLVFYDESRPGQRRWCATARCGNRANTKAYRARQGETA
jgi:predicted RNA-binding Zn ribbon-like protein